MEELKCPQRNGPHDSKNTVTKKDDASKLEKGQCIATEVRGDDIDGLIDAYSGGMGRYQSEKRETEHLPIFIEEWIKQNPAKANQYRGGSNVGMYKET